MSVRQNARRGFVPEDSQQFTGNALAQLKEAAKDTRYLLNRGYAVKNATTFIGNHYRFSERQRLALARSVSADADIAVRAAKQNLLPASLLPTNPATMPSATSVSIDGFNTIITLEVALSSSPILRCLDGTVRDLAGLRGTYRIIEETRTAVLLILKRLTQLGVRNADFYLDSPVSNSGRLKALIEEESKQFPINVNILVICDVDRVLMTKQNVITSDAIILNACGSWINLLPDIIAGLENIWTVDLFS